MRIRLRSGVLLALVLAGATAAGCRSLWAYQYGRTLGEATVIAGDPDIVGTVSPNGCGPEGLLGFAITDCPFICFTEACNLHDLCYVTCGADKATCDDAYYEDMRALCAEAFAQPSFDFDWCVTIAYVYYAAVNRFGTEAFDFTQSLGCLEDFPRIRPARARQSAGAVVAPYPDQDDDLLPDEWEVRFGLDPQDASDPWGDPDGDGRSNLQELIELSDPQWPDVPFAGR